MSNKPEHVAYAYELRHETDEEWMETVKTTHPDEAWGDIEAMDYRNIRPLVEADADE